MVDFGSLQAGTASEAELKRAASEGKYSNHPVLGVLADSYANKNDKGVGSVRFYVVPDTDVDEVKQAIRGCSVVLDIGHRITVKELKNEDGTRQTDQNGAPVSQVSFAGKDKKKRITPAEREAKKAEADRKRQEREAKKAEREAAKASKPAPSRRGRR